MVIKEVIKMKYEDYEAKLNDVVKNPDSAATAVLDILKEIKADTDTLASLEAGISERDGRIRDLQDTNMKLFLRQTGDNGQKDDEDKTPDEMLDDLFKED